MRGGVTTSHWGSPWILFILFFNLVSGECMLSHFSLS